MSNIFTENCLITGVSKVITNVPAEETKKRLYFSVVATNIGDDNVYLWVVGMGFGNSPNILANAVYIPAEDYLPNRSQWKYPHKLVLPPGGSLIGFVKVVNVAQDWDTWVDFHSAPPETWDNPGTAYPDYDVINLSLTYAEVK